MPNVDYQRHSFLGGEVSPSLYERADMDKFGRWFSDAFNIRFRETGAFRNRTGFIKVADTKYNSSGEIIKLLAFQFNDEESFLIELGRNYARFYKDGKPIMSNGVPYEIETPFDSFTEDDIKYAQAGDTVFIVHPTAGIVELARLQVDGSNWEIKRFNTDILPMKEANDDKAKTMSLTTFSQQVKTLSLYNPDTTTYLDVSFTYNNNVVYTAASATLSEIYEGIVNALGSSYNVTLNGTTVSMSPADAYGTIADSSITFKTYFTRTDQQEKRQTITVSSSSSMGQQAALGSTSISYSDWANVDYIGCWVYEYRNGSYYGPAFEGVRAITLPTMSAANGFGAFGTYSQATSGGSGFIVDTENASVTYNLSAKKIISNNPSYTATICLGRYVTSTYNPTYTYNSVTQSVSTPYYLLTSSSGEFNKLQVGDCVLVKNYVNTQTLSGNYGVGTYTLGPVISDGKWRAYSLGNWAGSVQIQYSIDNQATWVNYYDWTSGSDSQPYNNSTSGTVSSDTTIFFRVILTVTAGTIRFFFTADSFSVNSYYKLVFKNSSTQAVVSCIKNDIGLFSNKYEWRLPAFSAYEGWPQTVGFYQNRLFFGKDYILYGSRSNDFWDFYEPISLKADDPLTMSLLSTKVNKIQNLVTQRSFFTFTGGGEFGIGSEGALTQNDKYMKQFSANGSAQCNPVLISDVILFVDKSFNSIRALKYSLEADGYEAPDITLTTRSLMQPEKIMSTDQLYEEKEALFLSNTGTVWVLKYITDQNILSWSHWRHAIGRITNICAVPNGAKHDLYIAVEANGYKWLEVLSENEYMDTVETFEATADDKISVTGGVPGSIKCILQGNKRYFKTVDENGKIETPDDTTQGFKVGSIYTSVGTLLSPVVQTGDYSHSNYEVKKPFKVFFYYLNSNGFKVGVEDDEKMAIEWQPIESSIDDEFNLTSGKKSVLIPSRFDGSARVSFVQEEPYPMEICDVLIQTDYGGK